MPARAPIKSTKRGGLSISTKAQAWYIDFAVALLLFTFTLVVYFSYTNNFQKQEKGGIDEMLAEAKSISSSLALSGYPNNWDNTTVIRIGIADEQKVNATKIKYFKQLDYPTTKKRFGTTYDYFVFFVNSKGEVININGICGEGYPLINTSYNIRSAYYYQDQADSYLKEFMNTTFKADIYFGDDAGNTGDIDGLISNISKYNFLVMEHPLLTASTYNEYRDEIENYSSNGNLFMLSGELTTAQGKNLAGGVFYKKSGQSESDRNSTVNNTDDYLSLVVGEGIAFRQAYYMENASDAAGFKQIATFNLDGKTALSRWNYGNGTVYFFSDFDVSYFNGNFTTVVGDALKVLIQGTCNPINVTGVSKNKLVKTERYLNYNSNVVKMVVYLWQ